jgi:predicted  nucleic acid-binding Zn-ribbon protein
VSEAELTDLLAVQDLDLAIDQHRHRRDHLPERAELRAVDTQGIDLARERDDVSVARDQIATRQTHAETELAAAEERASVVSRRLYGGEVSASRELSAMAADVESLKARASTLEDQVLELLEEREPLESRLSEIAALLAGLDERREALLVALAQSEQAVEADIAGLMVSRSAAAAKVSPGLLEIYETLRTRLGGVGVGRLVGNHCDGCHLTLSAVGLDRIRHLRPGQVEYCEQCTRILVP